METIFKPKPAALVRSMPKQDRLQVPREPTGWQRQQRLHHGPLDQRRGCVPLCLCLMAVTHSLCKPGGNVTRPGKRCSTVSLHIMLYIDLPRD